MRRSLVILSILAGLGFAAGTLAYRIGERWSAARIIRSTDDLDWLRTEFHLGESEMARIRPLHDRYLPECRQFCDRIAAKRGQLTEALKKNEGMTPEVEARLSEIAALRVQCQTAMLRHFFEVSGEMPPDQGRRYLAEMQRLTLGSHEQLERGMSGEASHGHH
jgi:hypothetical protein